MDNAKTVWNIDTTHSEINFKVKHMMISTVTGSFEKFDGKVEASNDDFKNGNFSFSAEIDSVNTNNKDRDNHLKSDEFFGAEKNPKLTFKSKSFDGEKKVGRFTDKRSTKEGNLETEKNRTGIEPYGKTKTGYEFERTLNRKTFGPN